MLYAQGTTNGRKKVNKVLLIELKDGPASQSEKIEKATQNMYVYLVLQLSVFTFFTFCRIL